MTSRKEISIDVRNLVVKHRNECKSYGEIAKLLNLSKSTVQTIFNNFENNGTVENKPRSGRPKKLNRRDVSFILKEVNKDPKINATKLATELETRSDITVHPRTIQRSLNNNGFHSRTPPRKPLISEKIESFVWSSRKSISIRTCSFGSEFYLLMSRSTTFLGVMEGKRYGGKQTRRWIRRI